MATGIDPESRWQPGHPNVVPAHASLSGTRGYQGLVRAPEAHTLSDLAPYVAYMESAASAASTSASTWQVVTVDQ